MELLHVLGNTYAAVAATALLPVYKLNDRDVVLIDTGYAKLDRAGLTALIDGSGWRLRAILCSHAHFDHTGNVRYLQERYGAKAAISLIEVVVTYFMDRAAAKGKQGNRPKVVLLVCLAILVEAAIVAVDGLGSNGVWVPLQNSFGVIGEFNDCWLDFMDTLSEGIAMPLGALLMSLMVGWEIKPQTLLDEIHQGSTAKIDGFFSFCMKFIVPLGMLLILVGQIDTFFHLGIF